MASLSSSSSLSLELMVEIEKWSKASRSLSTMGSSVGGAESCSPLSAERRNEDRRECLETFDSDMDFEDLLHKAATFFEAERTTLGASSTWMQNVRLWTCCLEN